MLQRLQEHQTAIAATLMESKDTNLMPGRSKWKLIGQLVEILTHFNLANETMSVEVSNHKHDNSSSAQIPKCNLKNTC